MKKNRSRDSENVQYNPEPFIIRSKINIKEMKIIKTKEELRAFFKTKKKEGFSYVFELYTYYKTKSVFLSKKNIDEFETSKIHHTNLGFFPLIYQSFQANIELVAYFPSPTFNNIEIYQIKEEGIKNDLKKD